MQRRPVLPWVVNTSNECPQFAWAKRLSLGFFNLRP
jgi:hypothetical protein